jgi:Ca2+-binding EF-hand superfamily protein|tara:strand:- start:3579 stop:3968 length:390 start_codon:yes stop_codon:yes gene_type:complete
MGAILSCYGEKKKSKEEYYREIFDGLDIDGTQTLDAVELQTVWELVKEQKLEKLNKELNDFVNKKQNQINNTKNMNSSAMLKGVDRFDLNKFKTIMKTLDLSKDELHEFWMKTKESEITNLQHLLEKYK